MQLARVIGTVVATQKDYRLSGVKLLVVQPLGPGGSDSGSPIVAADGIGAGVGETVFFAKSKDGASALPDILACCDAGISGIVDTVYRGEDC